MARLHNPQTHELRDQIRVGSSAKRRAARQPGVLGQTGAGCINFLTRRRMPSSSV